jgi:hypothetical protein
MGRKQLIDFYFPVDQLNKFSQDLITLFQISVYAGDSGCWWQAWLGLRRILQLLLF